MAENVRWRVEAPVAESLKANGADAVLVIRLGIAITAMRAAQDLYLCACKGEEPRDQRNRLWAFLLSVAYLHELRVTLQYRFPRVKELALKWGGTETEATAVAEVISGKLPFSEVLDRVRNSLVFHFNENLIVDWIEEHDRDTVLWAEGIGDPTGNVLYRAATDAASSSILPGVEGSSPEGQEQMRKLIQEVLRVTDLITKFFERAIAGYLNSVGGKMIET